MTPFFSIIIPTYNSSSTLDIALSSIVNQTYRNIEVLIIDGMSTDSTLDIARSYQKEFPNIIITSKRDRGIYDAMNKGVKLAKGEWIYFMGSDDSLFDPTTLAQFIKLKGVKTIDAVYGNVYSNRFSGVYDGEFDYLKLTTKNICHQAIFLKRKVFKKIGNFNLKYTGQADWDHNVRWFFSSKISKRYTKLIFANYADGGFSSKKRDDVFWMDKYFLFLKIGRDKLSDSELFKICNVLINFTKENKRYYKWVDLKIYKYKLRVRKKVRKIFK